MVVDENVKISIVNQEKFVASSRYSVPSFPVSAVFIHRQTLTADKFGILRVMMT